MREVEDASRRVQEAMRALDAHRHDGAPTLEREYRRALEAYFEVAERALGRGAEEDDVFEPNHVLEGQPPRERMKGHFLAARRALRLARVYRNEPGTSGRRERECIQTAQRHRQAIHALRLSLRPVEQLALPGLAKTRPGEDARVARTG
jgi:hypothetical protein